jgi:proteasome accessory factor A
LGQDTVYAFRFFPDDGALHPGAERVVAAVRAATFRLVDGPKEGKRLRGAQRLFAAPNSRLAVEEGDARAADGMIATGMPRCEGPAEALILLRAQEKIFSRAMKAAEIELRRGGHPGRIGLVKRAAPAAGRLVSGRPAVSIERYAAAVAHGPMLVCYRLGLTIFLPLLALLTVLTRGLEPLLMAAASGIAGLGLFGLTVLQKSLIGSARVAARAAGTRRFRFYARVLRRGQKLHAGYARLLMEPSLGRLFEAARTLSRLPMTVAGSLPCLFFFQFVAFRRHRRVLPAFLASRPVITGAGALQEDGRYRLDPPQTLRRGKRRNARPFEGVVLGNVGLELMRRTIGAGEDLLRLDARRARGLFAREQSLGLPLSSGNRAQLADFLRLGATRLIVDLVDAGVLRDAPRFAEPELAQELLSADSGLKASAPLARGGAAATTALELQRWFLAKARVWLKSQPAADLERYELLRLWAETLAALEGDPGSLVGRIDWVTKRYLIEAAAKSGGFAEQKRIDLAYHELGSGYFDWLEREGVALRLTSAADIERVLLEPEEPARPPLVTCPKGGLAYTGQRVSVRWDAAKVGSWWKPRLVKPQQVTPDGAPS